MAILKHEVWMDAGRMGDDSRRFLAAGPRLIWTFEAGSHFEAMTKYHQLLGREPYSTEHTRDFQPYPDEWLTGQD